MEEKIIGIYKIENLINGKVYIGQSWDIERRWKEHRRRDTKDHLHSSLRKYGLENFSFTILIKLEENLSTQYILDFIENEYIIEYSSIDPKIGYNKRYGGGCGRHSKDSKDKMSSSKMGHPVSKETGYKITIAKTGHTTSQATKALLSKSHIGKKYPNQKKVIHKQPTKVDKFWINNGFDSRTVDEKTFIKFIKNGWEVGRIKNMKNMFTYIHQNTEIKRIRVNFLQEYLDKGWTIGKVHRVKIHNNEKNLVVYDYEVTSFLEKGYELGSLTAKELNSRKSYKDTMSVVQSNRVYIHLNDVVKRIKIDEFDIYINLGWKKGKKDKKVKIKQPRKKKSKESIEKSRLAQIGHRNYSTPDGIEKMRKTKIGKIVINNGIIHKHILPAELNNYSKDEWVRGYIRKS